MARSRLSKLVLTGLLLLLIPWIASTTGCAGTETGRPPIADTTLIPLLAELHLARARQEIEHDLLPAIRDSIYRRYGTDSTAFAHTLGYYAEHLDEYRRIYEEVTFQLQEMRRDTADAGQGPR